MMKIIATLLGLISVVGPFSIAHAAGSHSHVDFHHANGVGVTMGWHADLGKWIVEDAWRGSPAATAGVETGDTIISVNDVFPPDLRDLTLDGNALSIANADAVANARIQNFNEAVANARARNTDSWVIERNGVRQTFGIRTSDLDAIEEQASSAPAASSRPSGQLIPPPPAICASCVNGCPLTVSGYLVCVPGLIITLPGGGTINYPDCSGKCNSL